jgi:uncharacterized protein
MAYYTPGVYVKEKSLFPPSVAQVETAVPAFIGYTEKAFNIKADDLMFVAKRIRSLKEFEKFFGFGPKISVTSVNLANDNSVISTEIAQDFILYDALKIFFANGGGDCYIISVGTYVTIGAAFSKTHFLNGLEILRRVDEPTLILFPDLKNLTFVDGYYDVQKAALAQAGELMDRFCVLDVHDKLNPNLNDLDNKPNFDLAIEEFRNNIGMNELKFGAAYTPWINGNITKNLTYRDIRASLFKNGVVVTLKGIAASLPLPDQTTINAIIDDYEMLINDELEIEAQVVAHYGGALNIKETYNDLVDTFKTAATTTPLAAPVVDTARQSFRDMIDTTFTLADMIDDLLSLAPATIDSVLFRADIDSIATGLAVPLNQLSRYDIGMSLADYVLEAADTAYPRQNELGPPEFPEWESPETWMNVALSAAFDGTDDQSKFTVAATDEDRLLNMLAIEKDITSIFNAFYTGYNSILKTLGDYLKNAEQKLIAAYPVYKNIINAVNNSPTKMPPSPAVAGKYAYVDNTRGVWKAPANVSLDAVNTVCYQVEDREQESLNVDVNSGKSVNVIRYFTGKGNLIWGARTLAGNDNEWRYISVRRFFNMVEESVKKSTAWAVFEPNDSNTWVKVKGMIDNFLTLQWRNGALQGAKPDQAFYVKVGLGETMTYVDVLEGRMNVEIGMAVVRPAEFIILTFSHLLVES